MHHPLVTPISVPLLIPPHRHHPYSLSLSPIFAIHQYLCSFSSAPSLSLPSIHLSFLYSVSPSSHYNLLLYFYFEHFCLFFLPLSFSLLSVFVALLLCVFLPSVMYSFLSIIPSFLHFFLSFYSIAPSFIHLFPPSLCSLLSLYLILSFFL